ncbi:MAG: HEPN domain-containing protein [Prevotellaceae bacterium]|nr:HEPN domain-containing protein [Prevotellaceae bacterium]MDO4992185.1 HEPN domain-containing protein [Prevotellaceae bacterium]
MSLSEQQRMDLVKLYWEKYEDTWTELELSIKAAKWNMAANRLYYSLFHATTALFVKDGHKVGTHRGTKAAIGEHYVLTGKMSAEHGRLFAQLSSLRDKADYDVIFKASENEILLYVEQAKNFILRVKELLCE